MRKKVFQAIGFPIAFFIDFIALQGYNYLYTFGGFVMKKIISLIKRGIKVYSNKAFRSKALTPTGTIPTGI